jgi:hypothetical protein
MEYSFVKSGFKPEKHKFKKKTGLSHQPRLPGRPEREKNAIFMA